MTEAALGRGEVYHSPLLQGRWWRRRKTEGGEACVLLIICQACCRLGRGRWFAGKGTKNRGGLVAYFFPGLKKEKENVAKHQMIQKMCR